MVGPEVDQNERPFGRARRWTIVQAGIVRRFNRTLVGFGGAWRSVSGLTLARQFQLAAVVILGLAMVFLAAWVNVRIRDGVLRTSAEAGALYMESFLEPHVQALGTDRTIDERDKSALDRISKNFLMRRHIVSIKIWRRDGTVVYSYPSQLTGQKFETDEIEPALEGRVIGYHHRLDESENAFERSLQTPLYEIYAPLFRTGTREVIAVGEFYSNATKVDQEILRSRIDTWAVVGSVFALMLLLLFAIVQRGSRTIERQKSDLQDRIEAQKALLTTNEQLLGRIIEAQRETARVDELLQRRVGSDLHDGPAQLLTLVLLRFDEIEALVEDCREKDSQAVSVVAEIREAARQALAEIRAISAGLFMPHFGEGLSLEMAVREIVHTHERRTGTTVTLQSGVLPETVGVDIVRAVARITQEGLTNAFKHAGGKGQRVSIDVRDGVLHLEIADEGTGWRKQPSASAGDDATLGLVGMRARSQALGGSLHIDTGPEGTTISCRIPILDGL